jgi:hypothetical protein
LDQLVAIAAPFFSSLATLGEFAPVSAADMTEDYQALLAHDDHMTVTVEAYHDCRVDVRVLDERRTGEFYSRTSVLACQVAGNVVQFGIMRIDGPTRTDCGQRNHRRPDSVGPSADSPQRAAACRIAATVALTSRAAGTIAAG